MIFVNRQYSALFSKKENIFYYNTRTDRLTLQNCKTVAKDQYYAEYLDEKKHIDCCKSRKRKPGLSRREAELDCLALMLDYRS